LPQKARTLLLGLLGHHLEDLASLVQMMGYKYGLLLQLNNLDIGEIHEEKQLKYLFNELRDYVQTNNVNWMLVGDVGLRKFIAQQVDRLDDIVNYETQINSLDKTTYIQLINKRITFYRNTPNAQLPIDQDVLIYLFELTKGRLRYVFGLVQRLLNELSVGDLVDRLTLDLTKPMVVRLARERLLKNNLTTSEEEILKTLVKLECATSTLLANELKKSRQYISKILVKLYDNRLLDVKSEGRNRVYLPVLDVVIAYTEIEKNPKIFL